MVEVTQADRDAAADTLIIRGASQTLADNVREGRADMHHLVQAFARHRIAVRLDTLEEAAQVCDAQSPSEWWTTELNIAIGALGAKTGVETVKVLIEIDVDEAAQWDTQAMGHVVAYAIKMAAIGESYARQERLGEEFEAAIFADLEGLYED